MRTDPGPASCDWRDTAPDKCHLTGVTDVYRRGPCPAHGYGLDVWEGVKEITGNMKGAWEGKEG